MHDAVFVYGTLMDARIRFEILGYDTLAQPDALLGFTLGQIQIGNTSYPILDKSEEGMPISGLVFYTNGNGLSLLDEYETKEYRRIRVKLVSGRNAWVYVR